MNTMMPLAAEKINRGAILCKVNAWMDGLDRARWKDVAAHEMERRMMQAYFKPHGTGQENRGLYPWQAANDAKAEFVRAAA